jgi:hypothetical protein
MYNSPYRFRKNVLTNLQRVDPNRIYWQRAEAARAHVEQLPVIHADEIPSGAPRPPSYVSEDGVAYVIEAAPRSIAPTVDVPLPQHPSERGRVHIHLTLDPGDASHG